MAVQDPALRKLEQALAERLSLLDEICGYLFQTGRAPPSSLLDKISIHQSIASNSSLVSNPKAVRPNAGRIVEKFAPNVEVVVGDESGSGGKILRCPISQSIIVDEWRGKCGHSFERAAVLSWLSQTRTCPVLGCGKTLEEKPSARA